MAINWSKYKTYDTSGGHGSRREWKQAFSARMGMDEAETIIREQTGTPWEILGLVKGASQDEIKKAFRQLIQKWHPDKNPNYTELAEKMSKQIIAAYTILKK